MWMLQIDVILLHSQESQSQLCEDKDKMRRDNYELRESLERHLHLIEHKDRTIKTLQVLQLIVELSPYPHYMYMYTCVLCGYEHRKNVGGMSSHYEQWRRSKEN